MTDNLFNADSLRIHKRFWLKRFPGVIKRYRRKSPKVDESIFDSALSHTHRSDASEKREKNTVSTFGRFRLRTSFESSPVSAKNTDLTFTLKPHLFEIFLALGC